MNSVTYVLGLSFMALISGEMWEKSAVGYCEWWRLIAAARKRRVHCSINTRSLLESIQLKPAKISYHV